MLKMQNESAGRPAADAMPGLRWVAVRPIRPEAAGMARPSQRDRNGGRRVTMAGNVAIPLGVARCPAGDAWRGLDADAAKPPVCERLCEGGGRESHGLLQ